MEDHRITEVKKIVEALVTASMYEYTKVCIDGDQLSFTVADSLLYTMKLKNIDSSAMYDVFSIAFNYNEIKDLEGNQYVINYQVMNQFRSLLENYNMEESKPPIAVENNLRDNRKYEELISMKADDGMKYFMIPRSDNITRLIFIPVFSGFPALNKQDTISVSVFEDSNESLIVRYDIFKKKINRDISIHFRVLELSR